MNDWHELFDRARSAFVQQRTFERARQLGASGLACLGRHTVAGLLCATGQQFVDWSSSYRLFEQERLNVDQLWQVPLQAVVESLPPQAPVVALIDDTLVRKRGRRIGGTSWRRDPLGPHFTNNFIWASRFLQLSLALPAAAQVSSARAIPVDLVHAPSPRKPSRRADAQPWANWRLASAASTPDQLAKYERQRVIASDGKDVITAHQCPPVRDVTCKQYPGSGGWNAARSRLGVSAAAAKEDRRK